MTTDWTDLAAVRCDHLSCVATGRTGISDLIRCGWRIDTSGDGRGDHHHDCCPTHAPKCNRVPLEAS